MSIANARSFIKRGMADSELRSRLNRTSSLPQLNRVLAEQNLVFSFSEFNDAYANTLIQCQFEDDANQLKQFKMWWDLLLMSLSNETPNNKGNNDEKNHVGKDF